MHVIKFRSDIACAMFNVLAENAENSQLATSAGTDNEFRLEAS